MRGRRGALAAVLEAEPLLKRGILDVATLDYECFGYEMRDASCEQCRGGLGVRDEAAAARDRACDGYAARAAATQDGIFPAGAAREPRNPHCTDCAATD